MRPIHRGWLLGGAALAMPGCVSGPLSVEGAVNGPWIQVCQRIVPLAEQGAVVLAIKSCRGRREARIVRAAVPPGSFFVRFDGDGVNTLPLPGVKKPPPFKWPPEPKPPHEGLLPIILPLLPLLEANGIEVRTLGEDAGPQ